MTSTACACPTCGRELDLVSGLTVDLTHNAVRLGKDRRMLQPQQAELLFELVNAKGRPVSCDRLIAAVYGSHDDVKSESPEKVLRVYVSKLRRLLEPWPVVIVCDSVRSYQLIDMSAWATIWDVHSPGGLLSGSFPTEDLARDYLVLKVPPARHKHYSITQRPHVPLSAPQPHPSPHITQGAV